MALIRRIFARKPKSKSKSSKHSSNIEEATNGSMSDQQVDEITEKTVSLNLEGEYNPDTVPYEVATFALS